VAIRERSAVLRENAALSRAEAPIYEQNHFEIFHPWEQRRLIRDLSRYAGRRSLDVAAGTGNVVTKLRGGLRVALDLSPEMLAVLRRADPGVHAVVGLAEALPFRDGAFDSTVMYSAVHHLADLAPLAEMARVTRAGGVVLLDHEEAFQEAGPKRVPYAVARRMLRAIAGAWYWRRPAAAVYGAYRRTYWPHSGGLAVDFVLTDGGHPDPDTVERELRRHGLRVTRRHYLLEPLPMVSVWQRLADGACRRWRLGHFAIEATR
jgi:ubiquinone/menaquinone biosynthesis C-methylase UbiE